MVHIALIGAGKMGSALFHGLRSGLPTIPVAVADRNLEKAIALTHFCSTDPNEILLGAKWVVLAVKPQSFTDLLRTMTVPLADKLVISIMAGITLSNIRRATGSETVIRAMPNIGVQVGRGVTGWVASPEVTSEQERMARRIFTSFGSSIQLDHDGTLDAFTALAGSGPAYYFHLCALLQQKAELLGFSPSQAAHIARETFLGSALLLDNRGDTAVECRDSVSSKGGTTEAALMRLKKDGFHDVLFRAIDDAILRSGQLNNQE